MQRIITVSSSIPTKKRILGKSLYIEITYCHFVVISQAYFTGNFNCAEYDSNRLPYAVLSKSEYIYIFSLINSG